MKPKLLILTALGVQFFLLMLLLFVAPEPRGFLKVARANLDDSKLAAAWAAAPELKGELSHEIEGAMGSHALQSRASLLATIATVTLLFLLLASFREARSFGSPIPA